ncbi:YeeE/YedE thiosulfate transporter family protein [Caenispirillum salinarum]|uniref:YeeE/YedE thiosulfate transporter family protein n=1 Tax=Caenispirillum salinarum TaxID=859058 RepID=UPI00384B781F
MTVLWLVILGLAMGLVFGIALEKGRVFEPGVMIGQFQLRSWIMLKMFLTAIATGLVVLAVLNGSGLAPLHPKGTEYLNNLIGGLIFGAGIAIAGACPGTVLAQIGAGYKDSWFILAGAIFGAMAYGYAEPALGPALSGGPGKLTIAEMTGLPYWALALILAVVIAGGLVFLERWRPWRDDLGTDHTGVPTGSSAHHPSGLAHPAE